MHSIPPHTAKQAVTLPLDTATPEPTLCTISVTGAYPLLSVADVQGACFHINISLKPSVTTILFVKLLQIIATILFAFQPAYASVHH